MWLMCARTRKRERSERVYAEREVWRRRNLNSCSRIKRARFIPSFMLVFCQRLHSLLKASWKRLCLRHRSVATTKSILANVPQLVQPLAKIIHIYVFFGASANILYPRKKCLFSDSTFIFAPLKANMNTTVEADCAEIYETRGILETWFRREREMAINFN